MSDSYHSYHESKPEFTHESHGDYNPDDSMHLSKDLIHKENE